ncbi:hypothetical protein M2149_000960 [Lachnospiraceae bacterium PFB1-21]
MEKIKNSNNKTVCQVNRSEKMVEIIQKGFKTLIYFLDDGTVKIINQ